MPRLATPLPRGRGSTGAWTLCTKPPPMTGRRGCKRLLRAFGWNRTSRTKCIKVLCAGQRGSPARLTRSPVRVQHVRVHPIRADRVRVRVPVVVDVRKVFGAASSRAVARRSASSHLAKTDKAADDDLRFQAPKVVRTREGESTVSQICTDWQETAVAVTKRAGRDDAHARAFEGRPDATMRPVRRPLGSLRHSLQLRRGPR